MSGEDEGDPGRRPEVPDDLYEVVVRAAPTGLVVLDEEGVITWANRVYADKLDVPHAELVGTYFPELVDAGFYDESVVDEYLEAVDTLRTEPDVDERSYVVRTYLPDGDVRFSNVHLALLPAADGEFRGTISAFQDITTRREYEWELKRRNDQLEAFTSVVSHDLRNPLNVAQGNLERALETGDRDALREVARAHDRMETLIEDVLSLAREGRRVRDTDEVDLRAVVRRAWNSVGTDGAELRPVDDLGTVDADPSRLQQAFENLFRNAVEHGSTSSRTESGDPDVTVRVGRTGDGLYVEDDGPGIPESEREAVFDRGYTTAEDGTGFGLAIVEVHGWTVEVADAASETGGDPEEEVPASTGARFEVTTTGNGLSPDAD